MADRGDVAVVASLVADADFAVVTLLQACGNHNSLRASFCPSPLRWRAVGA